MTTLGENVSDEEVVVYWAPCAYPDRTHLVNLLLSPPNPLIQTFPPVNTAAQQFNYRRCPATQAAIKNTFVFNAPITATALLSGSSENPILITEADYFAKKASSNVDCYSVMYDYSWIFFSEESLIFRQSPAYLHRTTLRESGDIMVGQFDISKWFRSVNVDIGLWKGINNITVTEGEPLFYAEFFTNKKVVLKQFDMGPELFELSMQVLKLKSVKPNLSLFDMYDRFKRSNRDKAVLKLIKENLLDK